MNIALHITASPYSNPAAGSALHFARAVIGQGHQLSRVFFSGDGVLNATRTPGLPGDPAFAEQWLAFVPNTELIACVTACLKRGILDEALALRYRTPATIANGFIISGLGQLAESVLIADRVVSFG